MRMHRRQGTIKILLTLLGYRGVGGRKESDARMIEIFEPDSAQQSYVRAKQELMAASAAPFLVAKAAHLELAARHLAMYRSAGMPKLQGRPTKHLL